MRSRRVLVTLALVAAVAVVFASTSSPGRRPAQRDRSAPAKDHRGVLGVVDRAFEGSEAGGEKEGIRDALKWFYGQRAYPRRHTPAGALVRGRTQTAKLPVQHSSGPARPGRPTAAAANWTLLGPNPLSGNDDLFSGDSPFGGRVTVVQPVGDGARTYIGTADGGVWRTTDAGVNWTPLFDGQPSLAIGAIAVVAGGNADGSGDTLWVGTGEPNQGGDNYYGAGVFRSTNGGANWSHINGPDIGGDDQFDNCAISDILVKTSDTNTVLVSDHSLLGVLPSGTCFDGGGVWRSTNANNATPSWGTGSVLAGPVTDLALASSTTYYAGVDDVFDFGGNPLPGGVYKSTDSGANWGSPIGTGDTDMPQNGFGRINLAIAPADASRVYAGFAKSNGDILSILTSGNGGAAWTKLKLPAADPSKRIVSFCNVGAGGQCFYDMAFAVDSSGRLYGAGINFFRWNNPVGSPATAPVVIGNGSSGIHVDFHALGFDSGGRLWIGNDGGIYTSANPGAPTPSFTNRNNDLPAIQFYPGTAGSSTLFLGGTQDNGTARFNGSANWARVQGGDGGFSGVNPNNTDIMYASVPQAVVFKDTNGGNDGFPTIIFNNPGDPALFIAPFVMSPSNPARLFVGTNALYRSTNSGGVFSRFSPNFSPAAQFTCGCFSAIAEAPSDADVVYGGMDDGRFQVTEIGGGTALGSWNERSSSPFPNRFVTDIVVDPSNASKVYASVSGFGTGHVFRSTTAGSSWTNISGNLPDVPVNALARDTRFSPPVLYAGTDTGVLFSSDDGATWATYGTGLPPAVVMDLLLDTDANKLVAATHGRGAFTVDSFTPGNGFFLTVHRAGAGAASSSVTSNDGKIDCPPTCSAFYSSGDSTVLTAHEGTGANFENWSGGGCSGTGTCNVTLDANKTVTATFSSTDATKPHAFMDKPSKTINISKSIPLQWHGTDTGGSDVANFDLRVRKANFNAGSFGSFSNIGSLQHTTSQSATFTGASGFTFCFSARARDGAGNVGGFSSEKCTEVPVDDKQMQASSGWTRKTGQGGAFLGTLSDSKKQGATLKLSNVHAKTIGFLAKRCSGCGSVQLTFSSVGSSSPISLNGSGFIFIHFTPFSSIKTGNVTLKVTTANKLVHIDGVVALRTGTVSIGPVAPRAVEVRQIR